VLNGILWILRTSAPDNAYESDRLDAELARYGVELIAPHRRTRTQWPPMTWCQRTTYRRATPITVTFT
jgi:hypothetical protein